jgi:Xaa-Pro dipeptidase
MLHRSIRDPAAIPLTAHLAFRMERTKGDAATMLEGAPDLDTLFAAHSELLRSRYAGALEACGFTSVLIHAGAPPAVFEDDQHYPFRVNAAFKSWVPLTDVPDSWLYFEPGLTPLLIFSRPEDFWYKAAALPEGYWTRHFEIRPAKDRNAAREALPDDLSRTAFIGAPDEEIASWGACANPRELILRLDFTRAVKSPYELACLRHANRLGARGHVAAARAFAAGATEFEIELAYLAACGLREQELPYSSIIAFNEAASVLHYQLLERRPPAARNSLLIDAGAEFAGYASDITRTYSFRDADFAALIGHMDELQQSLCASVRAGTDWRDIHLSAHHLTAELLQEADITFCDPDEAVDTGLSSVFLPHGIGHLLGLQVHDVGGLARAAEGGEIPRPAGHPYLRLTRVLEAGFVVTMEPGIYFNEQLLAEARADTRGNKINWARVEQFRPFGGIRVEDDLAVSVNGCENLTREAFSALQAGREFLPAGPLSLSAAPERSGSAASDG